MSEADPQSWVRRWSHGTSNETAENGLFLWYTHWTKRGKRCSTYIDSRLNYVWTPASRIKEWRTICSVFGFDVLVDTRLVNTRPLLSTVSQTKKKKKNNGRTVVTVTFLFAHFDSARRPLFLVISNTRRESRVNLFNVVRLWFLFTQPPPPFVRNTGFLRNRIDCTIASS